MNFTELNLRAPIQRAIKEFGYTTPSPIQQKAIPPVLEGRDLIGCAQTGTGKTAAFALPMLERLAQGRRAKAGEIRALILTPTRELALQIGQNFTDYGKYTGLRHTVIFGGVGQQPQVVALKKGLDVLIACPGRLNDLSNQGFVNLKNLEIFVLDEADRMLDMGFVHDVKRVVAKLPPKRQNLMFSATMPKEIEALASTFLTNPVMVKVNPVSSTVEKIEQSLYFVEKGNKLSLLIHLIKELKLTNALVFSRTKHGADKIVKQLEKAGITAAAIHGNKGQNARVTALENFKSGKIQVLVATDIAARGIDINELSHVFNFDLPEVAETYVHRIGRTARAGADGVAISFCAGEEREYLQGIEKLNRKKIPVVQDHPWAGKPSPVKAVLTPPVRGRKPATEKAPQAGAKKERGGAQPSRKIAQAASPAPRQEKEEQMNQNDNRGNNNRGRNQSRDNRAAKPAQNGQNQNGQGGAQTARGGQDSRNGQGGRNNQNNNRGGRDNRNQNQAPAQPKFDPRFLTPQAAEQVPHAPAAPRTPAPEMLDVRRMNQGRDNRNDRNNRDNRGGQNNRNGNNNNRNANNRNANTNARDDRNNRNDRAPQGSAPRAPQQGRPAPNAQGNNNRNPGAGNRNANTRDERNNNNRNSNNNRNDRRGEPARNGQAKTAGKVGHSGLQTVRSSKPMRTNEKDPGLVLITKKPPQQKFTDFDSYMSAHGGVTAPVEEYGDK